MSPTFFPAAIAALLLSIPAFAPHDRSPSASLAPSDHTVSPAAPIAAPAQVVLQPALQPGGLREPERSAPGEPAAAAGVRLCFFGSESTPRLQVPPAVSSVTSP